MITKQTVLILGAGASHPYGFPLGRGLFDKVVNDNSSNLLKSMSEAGFEPDELDKFRLELRRSLFQSVDAFLESTNGFMDIGKAVMA